MILGSSSRFGSRLLEHSHTHTTFGSSEWFFGWNPRLKSTSGWKSVYELSGRNPRAQFIWRVSIFERFRLYLRYLPAPCVVRLGYHRIGRITQTRTSAEVQKVGIFACQWTGLDGIFAILSGSPNGPGGSHTSISTRSKSLRKDIFACQWTGLASIFAILT